MLLCRKDLGLAEACDIVEAKSADRGIATSSCCSALPILLALRADQLRLVCCRRYLPAPHPLGQNATRTSSQAELQAFFVANGNAKSGKCSQDKVSADLVTFNASGSYMAIVLNSCSCTKIFEAGSGCCVTSFCFDACHYAFQWAQVGTTGMLSVSMDKIPHHLRLMHGELLLGQHAEPSWNCLRDTDLVLDDGHALISFRLSPELSKAFLASTRSDVMHAEMRPMLYSVRCTSTGACLWQQEHQMTWGQEEIDSSVVFHPCDHSLLYATFDRVRMSMLGSLHTVPFHTGATYTRDLGTPFQATREIVRSPMLSVDTSPDGNWISVLSECPGVESPIQCGAFQWRDGPLHWTVRSVPISSELFWSSDGTRFACLVTDQWSCSASSHFVCVVTPGRPGQTQGQWVEDCFCYLHELFPERHLQDSSADASVIMEFSPSDRLLSVALQHRAWTAAQNVSSSMLGRDQDFVVLLDVSQSLDAVLSGEDCRHFFGEQSSLSTLSCLHFGESFAVSCLTWTNDSARLCAAGSSFAPNATSDLVHSEECTHVFCFKD